MNNTGDEKHKTNTHSAPVRRVQKKSPRHILLYLIFGVSLIRILKNSYDVNNIAPISTEVILNEPSSSNHEIDTAIGMKREVERELERGDGTPRAARILMGILCRESDVEYQAMFRLLFSLHPLVCSLGSYARDQNADSQCQFIYTFVAGGNKDNNAPTELIDDSIPILLEKKGDDLVILNIKENMEDGKSQTWLYYATTLMKNEGLNFDYVGKMDTDTLIHLDDYFKFAEENLHPHPHNVRTMAGSFRDKSWWPRFDRERLEGRNPRERFFELHYNGFKQDGITGMHLYPAGQMYILSSDLAAIVVEDGKSFSSFASIEGVEDHDIGTIAFVKSQGKPIHLIALSNKNIFWNHPVKKHKVGWEEKWKDEISRAKTLFLPQNSTPPKEVEEFLSKIFLTPAERKEKEQINLFEKLGLGWSSNPPQWMQDLCPDVVTHYNRFPSFKERLPANMNNLPFYPTNDVAQAVCTIKIVQVVAASINARVYLHAGSHLGAVVHGQPIPWDDDVDLIMDYRFIRDLENICKGDGFKVHTSGVRLRCSSEFNSLKVYLHPEGQRKMNRPGDKYLSPYVDLFSYEIDDGNVTEVFLDAKSTLKPDQTYPITDFFPTRPYYFAGIHVLGPQAKIPESRYKFDVCKIGKWNHRLEKYVGNMAENFGKNLNCKYLSKRFPFRDLESDTISINSGNTTDELKIFPWKAATLSSMWSSISTLEDRNAWSNIQNNSEGQDITDSLKINEVEIDNSISIHESCTGPLKVTELNAERGRWWMEYATLLEDSDVIILNEMDIGMARSDNQHTTRLMAHHLGMNYAWGLEFIELTPGTEEDRNNAFKIPDFHGLHGNAFLTKCAIADAVIFRNNVGPYFDSKPNKVNAKGFEKRLGGRMGMFGKIIVDGKETVIGSINKLEGFQTEIQKYIGERSAVVAGDQDGKYCSTIGLQNIVSGRGEKTWPASCSSFGRIRGDNICSNMKIVNDEKSILPCVEQFGFQVNMGDHALTSAVLSV